MKLPHRLRCLRHRDLRLFFAGQMVSVLGTWMQTVAMSWLVYRLTGKSQMLGLVTFLTQVPALALSSWAGSLADRVSRRRMVLGTQINALLQAALLAVLTFTGTVQAWHLLALSLMLGFSYAFDLPSRHALLADIAGEDMPNAVALNSTIANGARLVGPALGGALVAWLGEGWCFAFNAISFLAVIFALWKMTPQELPRAEHRTERGLSHFWAGVAYARDAVLVRALLLLILVASFFALPYQALMPLVAAQMLHGGPVLLGQLLAWAGAGAFLGAITLLARQDLRGLARQVGFGASFLGLGLLGLSFAASAATAFAAMAVVGYGFIIQTAGTMTVLQGLTPRQLRGRVLGVFSTLFFGITPFGALTAGWAAAHFGTPMTLRVGALFLIGAAGAFHAWLPALRRAVPAQHPSLVPSQVP